MKSGSHFRASTASMNLRLLLTLILVPLMLLGAGVIALASAWLSTREVASHYVRLGEQMTATLAQHSDVALLYASSDSVAETAASMLENPLVREVRILGKQGKALYQQAQDHPGGWQYPMAANAGITMVELEDVWLFSSQVVASGAASTGELNPELALLENAATGEREVLGQVQLALSKQALHQARRSIFLGNLAIALFFSILLIAVILLLLRRVSQPLESLAATMRSAGSGDFKPVQLEGPREIQQIGETYNDLMLTREQRKQELLELNQSLEARVQTRTLALQSANKELETFSYSVSHDLRGPLRAIDGFSQALLEDYGASLDSTGQDYLHRIRRGAVRMSDLIDDMLMLSRVTRHELQTRPVDLSALAKKVEAQLREQFPTRNVAFSVSSGMQVQADPKLLHILLENLLGNAWKYTGLQEHAAVSFTQAQVDGETVFQVSDNGVGFDMRFADKLFGAFQRLHGKEFQGSGVGLATAQRIVFRHSGRIWADSEVDKGARFYFTLPGS